MLLLTVMDTGPPNPLLIINQLRPPVPAHTPFRISWSYWQHGHRSATWSSKIPLEVCSTPPLSTSWLGDKMLLYTVVSPNPVTLRAHLHWGSPGTSVRMGGACSEISHPRSVRFAFTQLFVHEDKIAWTTWCSYPVYLFGGRIALSDHLLRRKKDEEDVSMFLSFD